MRNFLRRARLNSAVSMLLYSMGRPIFRVARGLETQIAKRIRRNGGSAEYDGITLHFPRNVGIGFLSSISWHGTQGFEPDTWATLRQLIQRSATFLDIGSNIGFYSVLAKLVAPQVDVLSFEPVPALCEQSRDFHAANGVAANIYQIALSDTDGRANLYQPIEAEPTESAASTLATASWQARKPHKELIVETVKLDSFLANRTLGTPVAIKIDVEDHDAAVLRGAADTIRKYRPWIVCEILPRPFRPDGGPGSTLIPVAEQHGNVETVAALGAMNYAAFAITPLGYFRLFPDDFKIDRKFTDFLLLPNECVDSRRARLSELP